MGTVAKAGHGSSSAVFPFTSCLLWALFSNPITAQPVKCPGWKAHGCAFKQCHIFLFEDIYWQCCEFWWMSFHMPLLLVVFKWQHGSEGVKVASECFCFGETCPLRIPAKQSSQALHAWYLFYCSHFPHSLCHIMLRGRRWSKHSIKQINNYIIITRTSGLWHLRRSVHGVEQARTRLLVLVAYIRLAYRLCPDLTWFIPLSNVHKPLNGSQ